MLDFKHLTRSALSRMFRLHSTSVPPSTAPMLHHAHAALRVTNSLARAANDDVPLSPKMLQAAQLLRDATAILDELSLEERSAPLEERFAIIAAAYTSQAAEILMTKIPPRQLRN